MVLAGHAEHARLAEFKDEDESQAEYAYLFAVTVAAMMIMSVMFTVIVLCLI